MSDRCNQIQECAEALAAVSPYSAEEVAVALESAVNAAWDHSKEYRTLNGENVCFWCGELRESAHNNQEGL